MCINTVIYANTIIFPSAQLVLLKKLLQLYIKNVTKNLPAVIHQLDTIIFSLAILNIDINTIIVIVSCVLYIKKTLIKLSQGLKIPKNKTPFH